MYFLMAEGGDRDGAARACLQPHACDESSSASNRSSRRSGPCGACTVMRDRRPFRLFCARGCAWIDSSLDTAKIGSDGRVDVDYARLRAVFGEEKRFHTTWVKRVGLTVHRLVRVFSDQRTLSLWLDVDQTCQKRSIEVNRRYVLDDRDQNSSLRHYRRPCGEQIQSRRQLCRALPSNAVLSRTVRAKRARAAGISQRPAR